MLRFVMACLTHKIFDRLLRLRYANDPHVDVTQIVEIDAVWGEKTILDALDDKLVDYIIASHVIEHVPDPEVSPRIHAGTPS